MRILQSLCVMADFQNALISRIFSVFSSAFLHTTTVKDLQIFCILVHTRWIIIRKLFVKSSLVSILPTNGYFYVFFNDSVWIMSKNCHFATLQKLLISLLSFLKLFFLKEIYHGFLLCKYIGGHLTRFCFLFFGTLKLCSKIFCFLPFLFRELCMRITSYRGLWGNWVAWWIGCKLYANEVRGLLLNFRPCLNEDKLF